MHARADGGAAASEAWTADASAAAVDSSTCSVSQSFEAVEAGALEALEAGAARLRAALDSAGAVSTGGMRAAFLSREEWLPGANLAREALAGLSLQPASSELPYSAASIDGQQDVSELSAALALTQQLLARQREETSYYKGLLDGGGAGAAPPPAEASDQSVLLAQQAEAAARALRVELGRTREALAASAAKHDALLARCDRLQAERDAAEAARDALALQHAALVDERDALLEERDALRVQVYSPGVFVDPGIGSVISPLRAAAAELNAHFRSKSGASVRTGELEDAGGPSPAAVLVAQSGSPRRGSGQRASDGPDSTVSRLLARMGLSGEKDSSRTAE